MTDEIIKENEVPEGEVESDDILAEAEEINRGGKDQKKKTRKLEAEILEAGKKLTEKEAELAELNDKYLRLAAEYDNFRRRTAQERDRIYDDAYTNALSAVFPILDNLERASGSDNLEAVKKGLEMTAKAFADALDKMGVAEIETKVFDPNLHNAVMHVEDESLGENEIVEVFQKGYAKGDKVIRYAMVKVAN